MFKRTSRSSDDPESSTTLGPGVEYFPGRSADYGDPLEGADLGDMNDVAIRRLRRLETLKIAPYHVPITFSIVGVQKSATSSVYQMLARHKEIAGGPEKEMRHFIRENLDWSDPDLSDYKRPGRVATARLAGDATPEYIFWPHSLERIRTYRPDMKLIASFRDPIARAVSQWAMERRRDPNFPEFAEAIDHFDLTHVPDELPDGVKPWEVRRRSVFTRGLYGQQLRKGFEHFPPEQWLLLDFRRVHEDRQQLLDDLTDFLGVRRFIRYPAKVHQGKADAAQEGRPLSASDITRLVEVYATDLPVFAELSRIDISGWDTCSVMRNDLDAADLAEKFNAKLGLGR